ncbi:MAG: T9SS type A sorting domain-containing protein [Bacteroidetes bacterium]|nr:T9SS type A sorting domain-containing protein [Bacteroidota bacterium]
MRKVFLNILILFLFSSIAISQFGTKNFVGPTGGDITAIGGTTSAEMILIGVKEKGIFYSTTQANNWLATNLTNVTVNCFAFNPANQQIAYAGTNNGLYKSADGGKNWSNTTLIGNVQTIAISKKNPNIIFAGLNGTGFNGVARSLDGFVNWELVNNGLQSEALLILSIAIDPVKDSLIFIGTNGAGIFQSTDRGSNWQNINSNFSTLEVSHPKKRVNTIVISQDANFSNSVLMGTDDGAYFSLSRGGSWISLNLGLENRDSIVKQLSMVSDNSLDPGGPNNLYMATLPTLNSNFVYPSRGGLYRSSILQGTFQSWESKFKQTIYTQCFYIPQNLPATIFVGTSDGVYYSSTKGNSWERKNVGLNFLDVTKFAPSKNGDTLYISSQGGGVYRSIDFGTSWRTMNSGLEDPFVKNFQIDLTNASIIYAMNRLDVYKSINGGESWNRLIIPAVNNEYVNQNFRGSLSISNKNPNNIIVHSPRTESQYSINGGASWQKLNLPANFIRSSTRTALGFHSYFDKTIFAANQSVWMSNDLGTTWIDITGNLPTTNSFGNPVYTYRIHTSSNVDSLVYITRHDLSKKELMYVTTNYGNWTSTNLNASAVVIDKKNKNYAYVSSSNKTFFSKNFGTSWIQTSADSTLGEIDRIISSEKNKFQFYLATKSGAYTEFYSSEPAVLIQKSTIDIGSASIGEAKTILLPFKNVGSQDLIIRLDSADNAKDFYAKKNQTITIQPRAESSQSIKFQPLTAGVLATNIYFTTNDPDFKNVKYVLNGKGIARAVVAKKILIDSLHGINLPDISITVPKHFSGLIKTLTESGMQVTYNQTAFDTTGFELIILPPPAKKYSQSEILAIQKFVSRGGTIVMLADASTNQGNIYLNEILNDFRWKADLKDSTGLSIQTDTYIVDSTLAYQGNPRNILARQFINKAHPFLKNVDTLIFFGSTNIKVQEGKASIFLRGESTTFTINNSTKQPDSLRPTLIGVSQIGKGNIILLGDMDIWSETPNYKVANTGEMLGGIFAKSNLTFLLNMVSSKQNFEVKMPQQTLNERYMLFTIPYDLNSFNISQVLKDLGTINPVNWRLFKWAADKQTFLEFPNPIFSNFNRGDGYWLITKGEKSINFGNATLSSTTGYHELILYPGYNLIGNPFPYTVSWENSKIDSGIENKLWRWNKTRYEAVTTNMLPFEGYWVKNLTNNILKVLINPAKVGTPKNDPGTKITNSNWSVRLRALSLIATDEDNFIGMNPNAKVAKDEFDFSEPPASPSNYIQLAFRKNEWNENNGIYSSDIRPVADEGAFWNFEVSTNFNLLESKIICEIEKDLPEGFKILLLDKTEERLFDIKNSGYIFKFRKNELTRNFKLLVGREGFIINNSDGVPLNPPDYHLLQNYPNPFNPQTSIQYSLSYSGHVNLVIYNSLGQKVKVLVSQEQKIGNYKTFWDGKNEVGESVSAGIYFYQIKSGNYLSSKKMLLIK